MLPKEKIIAIAYEILKEEWQYYDSDSNVSPVKRLILEFKSADRRLSPEKMQLLLFYELLWIKYSDIHEPWETYKAGFCKIYTEPDGEYYPSYKDYIKYMDNHFLALKIKRQIDELSNVFREPLGPILLNISSFCLIIHGNAKYNNKLLFDLNREINASSPVYKSPNRMTKGLKNEILDISHGLLEKKWHEDKSSYISTLREIVVLLSSCEDLVWPFRYKMRLVEYDRLFEPYEAYMLGVLDICSHVEYCNYIDMTFLRKAQKGNETAMPNALA